MFQDKSYVGSEEFSDRFGPILDDIKTDSLFFSKWHLLSFPIFIFRRLIFVVICFANIPVTIRIQITAYLNLLIMIYQAHFRPLKRH